jgi:hypothetical protein
LVERFLLDGYKPQQLSTYALSLFRYQTIVEDESVIVGMSVLYRHVKVQVKLSMDLIKHHPVKMYVGVEV